MTAPVVTRPLADMGRSLRLEEVARILDVDRRWVRTHVRPIYRIVRERGLRVFEHDLEQFLAVRRIVAGFPTLPEFEQAAVAGYVNDQVAAAYARGFLAGKAAVQTHLATVLASVPSPLDGATQVAP